MMMDDKMLEKSRTGVSSSSRLRLMQFRRALGYCPSRCCCRLGAAVEFKVYPSILLPPPAKVAMVFLDDWDTVLVNAMASITRGDHRHIVVLSVRRAARPDDRPLSDPRQP